ncbi:aldo/keto reductase, partial [Burkholderia contaminans]|uniref:aldo/keto reductase n=1 Tax=Burkholderia contaminans TaxID=488447 RepID=UPI0021BBE576
KCSCQKRQKTATLKPFESAFYPRFCWRHYAAHPRLLYAAPRHERHHLHKPVVEQPQYNLFHRTRVEQEYARLYEDYGLGLTTWSPLASGLLTGKYRNGVPPGSRAQLQGYDWMRDRLTNPAANDIVERLGAIAAELGCNTAQLAIAWVLANPRVSSVITGASRIEQISDNMRALDVAAKLTPDVKQRIEEVVGDAYE